MSKSGMYALVGILVIAFGWTSVQVKRSELKSLGGGGVGGG